MSQNCGGGAKTILSAPCWLFEPIATILLIGTIVSVSDSVSIGGGNCASDTAGLACNERFIAIVAACLRVNELCLWNPLSGGLGLLSSSSLRSSTIGIGFNIGLIIGNSSFICDFFIISIGGFEVIITSWSLLTPDDELSPSSWFWGFDWFFKKSFGYDFDDFNFVRICWISLTENEWGIELVSEELLPLKKRENLKLLFILVKWLQYSNVVKMLVKCSLNYFLLVGTGTKQTSVFGALFLTTKNPEKGEVLGRYMKN